MQRRIGLIPSRGLGIVRRAIFFALLAWLPIAVWAGYSRRALPGVADEPLLHFGIHVRFLVAVPLLVLGEGVAHRLTTHLIPYFLTSGLVREEQREAFREIVQGIIRLRNGTVPWVFIAAIILAWLVFAPRLSEEHKLVWAHVDAPAPLDLGFGGWWLIYEARPIFTALLAVWLWRLILLFLLLKRIAALDLAIVPTHPDRSGGLGFTEKLPAAFSLFAFANANRSRTTSGTGSRSWAQVGIQSVSSLTHRFPHPAASGSGPWSDTRRSRPDGGEPHRPGPEQPHGDPYPQGASRLHEPSFFDDSHPRLRQCDCAAAIPCVIVRALCNRHRHVSRRDEEPVHEPNAIIK